jgi:anti-sigma B factor antagonist
VKDEPLSIGIESAGDRRSVFTLRGELDLSTIPRMESRLFGELRSKAGVVVDLTELSFIDSSGLAILIAAFRATGNGGSPMHTVVAPGSQVERVIRLAGIDRAIPVFVDRDQAIEALGNGRL